jgi:hypothetical protein
MNNRSERMDLVPDDATADERERYLQGDVPDRVVIEISTPSLNELGYSVTIDGKPFPELSTFAVQDFFFKGGVCKHARCELRGFFKSKAGIQLFARPDDFRISMLGKTYRLVEVEP